MGGLFIAVVMFFPDGLAGVWAKYSHKLGFFKKKPNTAKTVAVTTNGPEITASNDTAKKESASNTSNDIDVTNIKGAKA